MKSFNGKKRKGLKPLRIKPKHLADSASNSFEDDGNNHNDTSDDENGRYDLNDDDNESDSDWSCSSSINSATDSKCENEVLREIVFLQLKDEDIEVHLATELVTRSAATVNTMVNRYSKLLVWFYYKSDNVCSEINALQLLHDIVLRRFQLLTKYYKFLRDILLMKPSTIYNFNEDVAALLNWFVVFRVPRSEDYNVTTNDLYSVNIILKAMRKFYAKERRILATQSVDNTIEALISARKWPKGGLKELHDAVLSQIPWARKICSQHPSCIHDATVYSHFMQLLISVFYTGTVCIFDTRAKLLFFNYAVIVGSQQGRVGVFNHATNDTAIELSLQTYALDPIFKTSLQYGLQPLTTSDASIELLKLYVEIVRPKLMEEANDPLFISLSGSAIRIGRYVSAFFNRVCGLHINTTTIRSIIATESAFLYSKGEISTAARDSIQHISGHSGITAQKYYQKRSRVQDIENSSSVINHLLGNLPCQQHFPVANALDSSPPLHFPVANALDSSPPPHFPVKLESSVGVGFKSAICLESRCPTSSPFVHIHSNTELLSPTTDSQRKVPWTDTEIRIVGTWCKLYREQHPGNKNVVASCLHYIRSNKAVSTHFHPHHIADSTRLRWGWQKFQEQQEQAAAQTILSFDLK